MEIYTVLLVSVPEQVDVAVFRTKIFLHRLPHHDQSVILHVTTPALPECLSTIPENTSFEWNGIFTQRVKG